MECILGYTVIGVIKGDTRGLNCSYTWVLGF